MANPNPDIWGAPETWSNAKIQTITTSSLADTLKCSAVKIANFGGNNNARRGSLARGMSAGKITPQQGIDKTVCPCGQDSNVSAFGKIAIINEDSDLSATPTRIIERDNNINWCFCELQEDTLSIPNHFFFMKSFTYSNYDNKGLDQFAPDATYSEYNKSEWQVPYLSYQINSLVLGIQVYCITEETASNLSATWRYLDDWKNNYNTQPICGLRVVVMGVNTIDTSTLTLIYDNNTNKAQYSNSGMICVLDTIDTPDRNGAVVDTSFYGIYSDGDRGACGYFFMPTYISKAVYTGVFPAWNMFSGQQLKRHSVTEYSATYYYSIPYSDDNYNTIMKMVACFGCYFTPTTKYQFAHTMTDNDLYLPIIDDNGVTHGEYTRGSDNANNSLYSKNSIRDIDYDPTKPPTPVDHNTYSNITGFNTITNNAALTKFYVLDSANVEKLGDDLWTICDGLSSGDFEHFDGKIKDEFLTTNPIDSIIALKRFPFNIPHTFNPNKVAVQLGKSTGTAQGYRTFEILFGVNFKGVDIFPRFGDCFLDYSPYTKYELYIPFCGTVEINAGDVLGHKLNCQLLIDLLTGSCIAYIMADQLVIGTAKGSCGVDMQMSGAQTATMNANIFNGILNAQLAETQHITSIGKISLNPFKWYENIEAAETRQLQTQHDITHMVVPLHKMGSASPLLSWVQEFNARLMIYYPEGDVITSTIPPELNAAAVASFGHIKGFATATPGKVSSFQRRGKQCFLSGNIVADSIPCTDNERQRIIAAFNSGVYLPSL